MSILRRSGLNLISSQRTALAREDDGTVLVPEKETNYIGSVSVIDLEELHQIQNQAESNYKIADMAEKAGGMFYEAADMAGRAPESIVAKADLLAEQIADYDGVEVSEVLPHMPSVERETIIAGESMYPPYATIRRNPTMLRLCGESVGSYAITAFNKAYNFILAMFDKIAQFVGKYFGATARLQKRLNALKEKAREMTGKQENDKIDLTGDTVLQFCIPDKTRKPVYLTEYKALIDHIGDYKKFASAALDRIRRSKSSIEKSQSFFERLDNEDSAEQIKALDEIRKIILGESANARGMAYCDAATFTKERTEDTTVLYTPVLPVSGFRLFCNVGPNGDMSDADYASAVNDSVSIVEKVKNILTGATNLPGVTIEELAKKSVDEIITTLANAGVLDKSIIDGMNKIKNDRTKKRNANSGADNAKDFKSFITYQFVAMEVAKNRANLLKKLGKKQTLAGRDQFNADLVKATTATTPGTPMPDPNEISYVNNVVLALFGDTGKYKSKIEYADPSGKTSIKTELSVTRLTKSQVEDVCNESLKLVEEIATYQKSKVFLDNAKAARKFEQYIKRVTKQDNDPKTTSLRHLYRRTIRSTLDIALDMHKFGMEVIKIFEDMIRKACDVCDMSLGMYGKDD